MSKPRKVINTQEAAGRHAAGESLRSLAAAYGVTIHTLSRHLKRDGYTVRTRAEATSLSNKQGIRPTPKPWNGGHDAAIRRMRQAKLTRVRGYRNSHGCADCGIGHPAVLDLHHHGDVEKHTSLRPSPRTRGSGKGWAYMSWADIDAELAKCIVLCANCHRIRHYNEVLMVHE